MSSSTGSIQRPSEEPAKGFYDYPDVVVASPDQAKVLYEDTEIRVVQLSVQPKALVPMHRHPGRVDVALTDVHARTTRPDGTVRESVTKAGEVGYGKPVVHEGFNLSDRPWVLIEVELKSRAPEGYMNTDPTSPSRS